MTITVNGQPYELTTQNLMEIDRQQCIETGKYIFDTVANDIDGVENLSLTEDAEHLTDDDFYELGASYNHRDDYYDNTQDFYNIVDDYGLIYDSEVER